MGWLFTNGATKSDIIKNLIKAEENDNRYWNTIAHCIRGDVLWAVVEITFKKEDRKDHFIACYLLMKSEDSWGYKDMCESMGPLRYSCPLKYLKMTPVTNQSWRDEVIAYHKHQSQKLEIGQKINLINACIPWVVITSKRPLQGAYAGTHYRIPRRMLGDVVAA